jgi:UDP-N-acetylmuramyl pentapeptide phosphotransferase/UDP-N-acetylglucosamine-1-phosphate transferase
VGNFHLDLAYIPFAAFVIVAFSNAFNITDGLDGLSGGLLIICLIGFLVVASNLVNPSVDPTADPTLPVFLGICRARKKRGCSVNSSRLWARDY